MQPMCVWRTHHAHHVVSFTILSLQSGILLFHSHSGVSLCSDVAHIDGDLQINEGCVRLATANALLKLAKSQENPVSADVYLQLALTMQASLAASLDSPIYTLKTSIRQHAHVKPERGNEHFL
jgi:hypothetical protein